MINARPSRGHLKLDGGSSEKLGEATQQGRLGAPSSETTQPIWQLQQQVGNQAVQQLLRSGFIQAKLAISNPDDPEEREADQVAKTIMRKSAGAPASSPCACSHDGEMCEECQQKQSQPIISRHASAPSAPAHVPRIVSDVLRSPGHPLDSATRAFFEPRFGHDFSHVRVHTGAPAAESARSVGALAYTVGRDIVFGSGAYEDDSDAGRRLLAHELAHVTQQGGAQPYLRRAPCRSGAECQAPGLGDPAVFNKQVEKSAQDRAAALAAAPLGSAEAAKRARSGERAVHFENLLNSNGIPLRPEVGGFFVDPTRPPDVLGTAKCRFFPGGSPGTPPVREDKFCVMVPVEIEDEAKGLDINTPLADKQRAQLASLLAIGSHEMQHADFDQSRSDIADMARGPGQAGRPECNLYTVIADPSTVGDVLSEISALTAEFPVFFKNVANQQNPAAALESHERFNAITSQESLSGAITLLQCHCPCQWVSDYVFVTVMSTTANWPAEERLAFLRMMTRLIPNRWPMALQLTDPQNPSTSPAPVSQTPSPAAAATGVPGPTPSPATTVPGVPAPNRAPTIILPGGTSVVAACKGAADVSACGSHRSYVLNILPQAIANIRSVASPYSAAIADLYAAALPAAQAAAAPIPWGLPGAPYGKDVDATAGPVKVKFGATQFTFNQFTITLRQELGSANGQAFGAGGPIAFIHLNETSKDALLRDIAGVETTMVHETMHIFMEIIEGHNRARATGASATDPNLDRTSYAALQTSLETALLPFITQIGQLPSFGGHPQTSAAQDTTETAGTFLSEVVARTEAGIFANQRAGKAFGATDLRTLPPFFHAAEYWSPSPPLLQELVTFIKANQPQIDAAIQPIIYQIGEKYLKLRP